MAVYIHRKQIFVLRYDCKGNVTKVKEILCPNRAPRVVHYWSCIVIASSCEAACGGSLRQKRRGPVSPADRLTQIGGCGLSCICFKAPPKSFRESARLTGTGWREWNLLFSCEDPSLLVAASAEYCYQALAERHICGCNSKVDIT
ncbi:hypothetical protein AVEN_53363-1 [Araneus ventricosus]|uniref:Uncharacterized protein n=1 Tax=Araneus ventricosus TaxID=182803 RepID=A0A4Y2AAE4_ARAVE|nr:hypothetical protein AVEN_53363-1 [Araneus ventricosus]